jgi:Phosphotransferase system mannitol/fructose-specific IIA domain (Ntr-type)
MTSFDEIVPQNGVVADLRVSSKKQLLQELSERAGQLFGLDRRDVFETLLERERLGSTGVGNGVAIPHGKMVGLDRVVGLFVTLEEPVI